MVRAVLSSLASVFALKETKRTLKTGQWKDMQDVKGHHGLKDFLESEVAISSGSTLVFKIFYQYLICVSNLDHHMTFKKL
jgi:hypothetical protein